MRLKRFIAFAMIIIILTTSSRFGQVKRVKASAVATTVAGIAVTWEAVTYFESIMRLSGIVLSEESNEQRVKNIETFAAAHPDYFVETMEPFLALSDELSEGPNPPVSMAGETVPVTKEYLDKCFGYMKDFYGGLFTRDGEVLALPANTLRVYNGVTAVKSVNIYPQVSWDTGKTPTASEQNAANRIINEFNMYSSYSSVSGNYTTYLGIIYEAVYRMENGIGYFDHYNTKTGTPTFYNTVNSFVSDGNEPTVRNITLIEVYNKLIYTYVYGLMLQNMVLAKYTYDVQISGNWVNKTIYVAKVIQASPTLSTSGDIYDVPAINAQVTAVNVLDDAVAYPEVYGAIGAVVGNPALPTEEDDYQLGVRVPAVIPGENTGINIGDIVVPWPGVLDPDIEKPEEGTGEGTEEGTDEKTDEKTEEETVELPVTGELDFNGLKTNAAALASVFPFCIPFDFINMIKSLSVPPRAPVYTMDFSGVQYFYGYKWELDMSEYESLAAIVRWTVFIGFAIGLMMMTGRFIKW